MRFDTFGMASNLQLDCLELDITHNSISMPRSSNLLEFVENWLLLWLNAKIIIEALERL